MNFTFRLLCIAIFLTTPTLGFASPRACVTWLTNSGTEKILKSGTYRARNEVGTSILTEFRELSDGSREERIVKSVGTPENWTPVGKATKNRKRNEKVDFNAKKLDYVRAGTYKRQNSIGGTEIIEFRELADGSREERSVVPRDTEWTPVGDALESRQPREKITLENENVKLLRKGRYNARTAADFPIVREFQEFSDGSRIERTDSRTSGPDWESVGRSIDHRRTGEKIEVETEPTTVVRSGTFPTTTQLGFRKVMEFEELSDGSRRERNSTSRDPQDWVTVGAAIPHRKMGEKVEIEKNDTKVVRMGTYNATNSIGFPIQMEFQELADGSRVERRNTISSFDVWVPVGLAIEHRRSNEKLY